MLPAIHCPECDSVEIRLHCQLNADRQDHPAVSAPTCDLFLCKDCGTIWCPRKERWKWTPDPEYRESA